jgi:hypothetical protein
MRGWLDATRLPGGDFAGYAAEVESVRRALLRHGRLPVWDSERFAGTTRFMSNIKEVATLPLAQAFGPVAGTKIMFGGMKVVAALAMYLVFVRNFHAPLAGMLAGGAYAFGSAATHQTAQGGHLDVAITSALFPLILLAAVEMLRRRSWPAAVALGVLVGVQLSVHYLQAMVCPLLVLVLLCFRPWRRGRAEENPLVDRELAGCWSRRLAGAFGVFLLVGGSQLAWLAADLRHHQLLGAEHTDWGLETYVEHSPFLYVNRGDWLGPWLEQHRPPALPLDPDDPLFNERRYLGVVAIAVCVGGWFAARRHFALRRWYQAFAVLLLLQYWLSIGPQTLLWQLGRSFDWPEAVEASVRAAATFGAAASLAWALFLRGRARADEPISPARIELGLGLALVLLFISYSLFGFLRATVPVLHGMRSPGHFFDLAPFSFSALFGVAVASLAQAIEPRWLRHALGAILAVSLALDFWPSTASFSRGTSIAGLRRLRPVLARLPAEGGTLRTTTIPWVYSPEGSLLAAMGAPGMAWSWLDWQAGRGWGEYMTLAMAAMRPSLEEEKRIPMRTAGDALTRLGRIRYIIEDFADVSRSRIEEPWRLRAEEGTLALWERPEVEPMASGYRAYVLQIGGGAGVQAGAITQAFAHRLLLVSGGERLAAVDEDVIRGAALVRCDGPAALADPASRSRAQRHEGRVMVIDDAASRAVWAARLTELPSEPPVSVGYARPAPERIVLEVDAAGAPAAVFVSEAYHPWWQASVNGRPGRVLRAAGVFMGVVVEPGRHVIDLRLRRPLAVTAADWTTAAAWLVLALGAPAVAAAAWRRRRRNRRGSPAARRGRRRRSERRPRRAPLARPSR